MSTISISMGEQFVPSWATNGGNALAPGLAGRENVKKRIPHCADSGFDNNDANGRGKGAKVMKANDGAPASYGAATTGATTLDGKNVVTDDERCDQPSVLHGGVLRQTDLSIQRRRRME
mmetsp:Transcript_7584/g.16513  ORF Transcript_7584/g.16513 Transcript_7584/m.16513 type:complete len:119 (+) Transcript_7584:791-1147(+)